MADVFSVVVGCTQVLVGVIAIIEHATTALDRTKNGLKYLDDTCTQIRATVQVLEKVRSLEKQLDGKCVSDAVTHVMHRANDLKQAAEELRDSRSDNGFKVFLDEFFRGDARAQKFDRMQTHLSQAQITLISAMIAARVEGTSSVIVNINVLYQVKDCFGQDERQNCASRVIRLVEDHGVELEKGSAWRQVSQQELSDALTNSSYPNNRTVRIIKDSEFSGFGLATADVGSQGEGAPHIDEVRAQNLKVTDHAYVVAGTVSFETSVQLQATRVALESMRGDKQYARDTLSALIPGLNRPQQPPPYQ